MRLGLILFSLSFVLPMIAMNADVSAQPSQIKAGNTPSAPGNNTSKPFKPWLGVSIDDGYGGVLIVEVIPGTPADIAGMKVGDLVYAISGVSTPRRQLLVAQIGIYSVGDVVMVSLRRRSGPKVQDLSVAVTLSAVLNKQELFQRRLLNKVAPLFDVPVVHGTMSGRLQSLRGKVVILEFWSPECLRCLTTFSTLSALEAESPGDIVVLGISSDSRMSIEEFLTSNSVGITLLHDVRGDISKKYWLEGVKSDADPAVIVIGRDGVVRHADIGPNLSWSDVFLIARSAIREPFGMEPF